MRGDYCTVTIICGERRRDVALPSSVPCAELQPGLLRLLVPEDEPSASGRWVLTPMGRAPLAPTETLLAADVLSGDLLVLGQHSGFVPAPVPDTGRDGIEDVVRAGGMFWGPRASRRFGLWWAVVTAGLLLIPGAALPAGLPTAGCTAAIALVLTLTASLSVRESETTCAAVGLVIACGWAALAGAAATRGWLVQAGWPAPAGAIGAVTIVGAIGSALLLAVGAAMRHPPAVVAAVALLLAGCAALAVAVAATMGTPVSGAAGPVALLAVLVVGGLPRVALAVGGLTGTPGPHAAAGPDRRVARANRVLTGCLIGVSLIAVGGTLPAALAGAGWSRLLAAGVGLLLLLRSRQFTQWPHALGPRIGGLAVIAGLWLGLLRSDPQHQGSLLLYAAAGSALAALGAVLAPRAAPVAAARAGRILDVAEQLLVVALVVLAAGTTGLFDWMSAVIG